jgi:hypothetical protein
MAKHNLAYWLKQKNMTPEQLWRKGARVPTAELERWARTGEPPREVTQQRRCIDVSIALGITPDQLDCGPRHRGLSIGSYEVVISTRGQDGLGWEASVEASRRSDNLIAPRPVGEQLTTGIRTPGATLEESLDNLERALRELIAANPGGDDGTIDD